MSNYLLKRNKSSLNLPVLIALFISLFTFSAAHAEVDLAKVKEGKALFKSNCASCHNPLQNQTGPALKGVLGRWQAAGDFKGKTGEQWLHAWIHNFNDPVNAGYPYAKEILGFSPTNMNTFPGLKDDEIDKILLYVDNSTVGAEPTTAKTTTDTAAAPVAEESNTFLYLFGFLLFVLVAILVVVTKRLDAIVDESKGIQKEASLPFYKTRKFKAAAILVFLVWGGFQLADSAMRLGRQQGYQPTQPIRYNHALHAGKHKIDCQYCHTSAAKGKAAGIPSLNTCMNCHKNVQKGPEYGTEEIQKIYDAVGWDPAKGEYVRPAKPVQWVRIHNLPDHVYFNHSQHVVAGKVACQTCHGPIETMKEVYQFAPLSMGWCVNCHRQTEVQFGNNYYSTYEKLHEQLKNKTIDKVTVEKIGGTECAKCHY
jgi:cytochrome c2